MSSSIYETIGRVITCWGDFSQTFYRAIPFARNGAREIDEKIYFKNDIDSTFELQMKEYRATLKAITNDDAKFMSKCDQYIGDIRAAFSIRSQIAHGTTTVETSDETIVKIQDYKEHAKFEKAWQKSYKIICKRNMANEDKALEIEFDRLQTKYFQITYRQEELELLRYEIERLSACTYILASIAKHLSRGKSIEQTLEIFREDQIRHIKKYF